MNYGYWDAGTWQISRAFRNQNRTIAEALRVEATDCVLEAGCGTRGATVWLAHRHGCHGVGITLCRSQAARAQRIAAGRDVADRTAFLVMDFTRTGFPDASFDKVFASESACYALCKADFVREAYRLLRPGGRLVVIDGFLVDRARSERERRILDRWAEGWAVPGLASVTGFAAALREAGFRTIEFRDHTHQVLPSARRILARGLVAWPVARAAHAAGWCSRGQLAHVRSSIDQHAIWRSRLALHGVYAAQK
jgi:cyclopropane fatty-acyl-phospholipid synthase-like methyltransferase